MRWLMALTLVAVVLLSTPLAVSAAVPARPLALTSPQFKELCKIETQPCHSAMLALRASYTSEREKMLEDNLVTNDITSGIYQFGWPGAILTFALCGLPW